MNPRITRRKLVSMSAALPVAAVAEAQQPSTTPPLPATPDEERKAVEAQFKSNAGLVARVPLPITTEPAVHFKA